MIGHVKKNNSVLFLLKNSSKNIKTPYISFVQNKMRFNSIEERQASQREIEQISTV